MGDRCWLTATFKTVDKEKALRILDLDENFIEEERGDWIRIVVEEANYAMSDDFDRLAKAGVEFFGHHEEGGDYTRARFFSTPKGDLVYIDEDKNGSVTVTVNDNGGLNEREFETVKMRLAQWRRVCHSVAPKEYPLLLDEVK